MKFWKDHLESRRLYPAY